MMTANDNNDVALLAEVFRFLLPRPRRITYCIKNSGVCIGFFEKLRTFLPFCYLKCGLCNCKNGLLGVRRPFPRLQLGQIAENEYLSPGMSDDALHLRMGRITGHHEHCTGGFGLGSDLLYLLHEGAGSVVIGAAPGFQLVVNAAGDTVAADDHLVARRDISGGICYQCAPALKVFHGLGVVDEGAEGGHLAALIPSVVKNAYSSDFSGDVVVDDVAGDSVILSIAPDIESVLYYGTCVVTGQSVVWTAMDGKTTQTFDGPFPDVTAQRRVPDPH